MPCDCQNCKKDNILNGTLKISCSSCSTEITPTSKFEFLDGGLVICNICLPLYYTKCPTCDKYHKTNIMKEVDECKNDGTKIKRLVCEYCYKNNFKNCEECGGLFNKHDVFPHNDKSYCKSCFDKHYITCANCNSIQKKTNVLRKIRGNLSVCDNCYNFYGPIQLYDKKPSLNFMGIPPHYYGVELELELENQKKSERGIKADEVMDLLGKDFIIVKEDGSLNCGFEICTQPSTLSEHKIRWNKFFDNLPKNIISFSTPNCGLHIHCSKKPLTLLTIAKIVVFVNDENNKNFIEVIAGRKSCQYSCIQKKEYAEVKKIGRMSRDSRYEAVNLVNADTIEFRIFKGTLKRESFYKALEFCDAMIHFCATAVHSITYCRNKDNFINYVTKEQKLYPHLYAYICAKILMVENKLTQKFGFKVCDSNEHLK